MSHYPKIIELERYDFADGGYAKVSRLGWSYTYAELGRGGNWEDAPLVVTGLKRADAYARLEATMRDDIMDLSL